MANLRRGVARAPGWGARRGGGTHGGAAAEAGARLGYAALFHLQACEALLGAPTGSA